MMFQLTLTIAALFAPSVFADDAVVLERGKPVERELAGGQEHLYRVAMDAGEYAALSWNSVESM